MSIVRDIINQRYRCIKSIRNLVVESIYTLKTEWDNMVHFSTLNKPLQPIMLFGLATSRRRFNIHQT